MAEGQLAGLTESIQNSSVVLTGTRSTSTTRWTIQSRSTKLLSRRKQLGARIGVDKLEHSRAAERGEIPSSARGSLDTQPTLLRNVAPMLGFFVRNARPFLAAPRSCARAESKSDRCIGLLRGPDNDRHHGLSFIEVDMRVPLVHRRACARP
jgi:hypothetical protein